MRGLPIAISAEDRDLFYHRIMLHLSGIEVVWLSAHHRDFAAADRQAREYCDELRLVMDDLGWGPTVDAGSVELVSDSDLLRRVFERMRGTAVDETEYLEAELRMGREPDARRARKGKRGSPSCLRAGAGRSTGVRSGGSEFRGD